MCSWQNCKKFNTCAYCWEQYESTHAFLDSILAVPWELEKVHTFNTVVYSLRTYLKKNTVLKEKL